MPTLETLTVQLETRTKKFDTGMKTALGTLAALGAGVAYTFGKFEESQKVVNQTGAVLKSTGGVAHVTASQVGKLADAISRKAGIDDEAVQGAENLLLSFRAVRNEAGKGNQVFTEASKTIVDMSVAMGQDLKTSTIQVGKALQDPIRGLTAVRRVGVSFTTQQETQITALVESGHKLEAQKIILRELNTEFGGSAAAQATASGKMHVALENVAESIGGVLAPAINSVLAPITAMANIMQKYPAVGVAVAAAVGLVAAAFLVAKIQTLEWG